MAFWSKLTTIVIAGLVISVSGVRVKAQDHGSSAVSRTGFDRSGATGQLRGAGAAREAATHPCVGADGSANRALDGMTLEDFAPRALASLTPCELRTLENQIGTGGEREASLRPGVISSGATHAKYKERRGQLHGSARGA